MRYVMVAQVHVSVKTMWEGVGVNDAMRVTLTILTAHNVPLVTMVTLTVGDAAVKVLVSRHRSAIVPLEHVSARQM